MLKTLKTSLIFLTLLFTSVTVCGQKFLPQRIVYQGDTGIFLNQKQESDILQSLKYKEVYKQNLDSMFKFTVNCTIALQSTYSLYDKLQVEYDSLETTALEFKAKAETEEKAKNEALNKAAREENRKKNWRTVALSEGSIILTAIAFVIFF